MEKLLQLQKLTNIVRSKTQPCYNCSGKGYTFDGKNQYKCIACDRDGWVGKTDKPLTLREILLAGKYYSPSLQQKSFIYDFDCIEFEYVTYSDTKEDEHQFVRIPVDKEPKDYPEETLESLIELLS